MAQTKVLVIDDDEGMTELLQLLLSPASMNITISNSGLEGVEQVKNNAPDVIILDLMMPGLNGWQTCQRIREFCQVPILILSAIDSPDTIAQALDAGADDYLVKPVTSSTLIARLNKLLRRSQQNLTPISHADQK